MGCWFWDHMASLGPGTLQSSRGSQVARQLEGERKNHEMSTSWLCPLPGLLPQALGEGLGLTFSGRESSVGGRFTGSGWAMCSFGANPSPFLLPSPQRNEAKAPLTPKTPSVGILASTWFLIPSRRLSVLQPHPTPRSLFVCQLGLASRGTGGFILMKDY